MRRRSTLTWEDVQAAAHILKTWPAYWDAIASGAKPFEVRRDDRGYQRGDILILRRFDPLTARFCVGYPDLRRRVSYVMAGGHMGIEAGFVVLGLEPERPDEP